MTTFVARRLILTLPALVGISVIVFLVIHLAPGDPAELLLGQDATTVARAQIRRDLGLDQPLPVQYGLWLQAVTRGDLGTSIYTRRPVLSEVVDKFKATALLASTSLVISTSLGVAAGVVSATRRGSLVDKLSMLAALCGVSMPAFWLGLMLIVLFSLLLRWLPPAGMYSPVGGGPLDLGSHLVLPATTLSARSMAVVARLTRSTMLDVIGQDYIRTAQAKGLVHRVVVYRHALKNALIPVVTTVGVQIGVLLGGAVIVETVFAWPGLGTLIVQAIGKRDFPLVQGGVLFVATLFVLVNVVVDLVCGYLDPRIRYA